MNLYKSQTYNVLKLHLAWFVLLIVSIVGFYIFYLTLLQALSVFFVFILIDFLIVIFTNNNVGISKDYILIQKAFLPWKEQYIAIKYIEKIEVGTEYEIITGYEKYIKISYQKRGKLMIKCFYCPGIPNVGINSVLIYDFMLTELQDLCNRENIIYIENPAIEY